MSLMDVARGAYVRSPAGLRRTLAPLVSLVPTKLKFGGAYRQWRDKISLSAIDPVYANAQHLNSLRALMSKAHAGSPFYRDLIDRGLGRGFDLSKLEPADLRHLPILTKQDLSAAGDAVLTAPKSSLDRADTSGSNGERPFSFYLDRDRSAREIAFVHQVWSRAGFKEGDVRAVLRGFGLHPDGKSIHEWEPALREVRLSVFPMTRNDAAYYVDLLDRYRVRYLYGYPSAIEVLCRHLIQIGRKPKLPLLGILPISEPMFAHQRKTITCALGDIPIANFYGLSEKAAFATELPRDEGIYEFEPLYGLAELVDEDGATITEPGREGRVISTGFLTTGMPFIRYDTEDRARLVQLPTAENGQRLRVEALIPRRKPDFLIAADGNRVVTIDFTPENPRFFVGIDEYQFYQDEPGKCVIRYIPSPDGTDEDVERVRSHLECRAHGRMSFTVERVERLAGGRAGKRAFIDQRLDISRY